MANDVRNRRHGQTIVQGHSYTDVDVVALLILVAVVMRIQQRMLLQGDSHRLDQQHIHAERLGLITRADVALDLRHRGQQVRHVDLPVQCQLRCGMQTMHHVLRDDLAHTGQAFTSRHRRGHYTTCRRRPIRRLLRIRIARRASLDIGLHVTLRDPPVTTRALDFRVVDAMLLGHFLCDFRDKDALAIATRVAVRTPSTSLGVILIGGFSGTTSTASTSVTSTRRSTRGIIRTGRARRSCRNSFTSVAHIGNRRFHRRRIPCSHDDFQQRTVVVGFNISGQLLRANRAQSFALLDGVTFVFIPLVN